MNKAQELAKMRLDKLEAINKSVVNTDYDYIVKTFEDLIAANDFRCSVIIAVSKLKSRMCIKSLMAKLEENGFSCFYNEDIDNYDYDDDYTDGTLTVSLPSR